MDSAASTPLQLDMSFFGPFEVGLTLSSLLLGIATLQAWNYYLNFPTDRMAVKWMVAVVYVADVLQTAFFAHTVYWFTIIGPQRLLASNDYGALTTMPWTLEMSAALLALINFIVQAYFCHQVKCISQSTLLASGCFFLAIMRVALTAAILGPLSHNSTLLVIETHTFKAEIISELAVGTTADVLIAGCMCIGLHRRRTGFAHSDRLVDRLVSMALGSGLTTTVVSVIQVVSYAVSPTSFIWIACFSLTSKLFTNSLLASLNRRERASTSVDRGDIEMSYPSGSSSTHVSGTKVTDCYESC
ncbi:hypothetical protein EXIGLDRAFT_766006 [Exidia glandulosa HHB12029]|uniref:DUF6534 domain-containing protein n=1 Tax=Exidia glandulosa HHB12029 TaxID=1314781 RepID=A0A165K2D6_EXIGL|nr:hypothetical protein EXIGLDRAFT_766006 [Exidia glandulosa HHB12029]